MKTLAVTQRMKTILILAVPLLGLLAGPLAGQSAGRMWAAQTGPDQVTLRLRFQALIFSGLDLSMRTLYSSMAPGSSNQFQADLMEVSCEN